MGTESLLTPERLREDLQHIKEWMTKQPHLPNIDDDDWLLTILHCNKYSLEKTKGKLDKYFTFRTKYPEVLKNRDPTGPEIVQARAAHKMSFANKLTKDGELILFNQVQPNTEIFDMTGVMKMFFMLSDLVYLENSRLRYVTAITDCRYLNNIHFLKAIPWFKLGTQIFFNCFSGRVKAVHVVNTPAHLDKIVNTMKGLLPKKIAERVYVHSTYEDLCKLVDEDVVCSDFGGKGPSLDEYDEYTTKTLKKHRKWFLEQDDVCSIEELRRRTGNEIKEMEGSFRKLEVD